MEKCSICQMLYSSELMDKGRILNHRVYVCLDHEIEGAKLYTKVDDGYLYTLQEGTWWGEHECAKGLFLFEYKNKYGFARADTGEIIIEPTYDDSGTMHCYKEHEDGDWKACAHVTLHGKAGVIDSKGDVILPFIYDDLKSYPTRIGKNYYICAMQNNKWGILDYKGNEILEFLYDDIGRPSNYGIPPKFICLLVSGDSEYRKVGILSEELMITIPPVLDRLPINMKVLGKYTAYYYIRKGRKWGAIHASGRVIFEPFFLKREINEKITAMCEEKIREYINHQEDRNWLWNAFQDPSYVEIFGWDISNLL